MNGGGFTTLKLERNVARAPIWASRSGIPLQQAIDWPELPFNGGTFGIAGLSGTLGPTDLMVFTRASTIYAATRPSDRRVELGLGDIARWMGNRSIGGSQRRAAVACLNRLLGATFNSSVRFGAKGSEQLLHGWGLIDEWLLPERGRHTGSVRVSSAVADLLDAGSVVLLNAATLETLMLRSGLAARLWVFLEAETLGATGLTDQGQPYPLFAARLGEPARELARPTISDLCRLIDPRRRRVVALLRRACGDIEDVDTRYRLSIEPSARGRESMWNLWARRWPTKAPLGRYDKWADLTSGAPAPATGYGVQKGQTSAADRTAATWGTLAGNLGDGGRADRGTEAGTLRDAPAADIGVETRHRPIRTGAPWGTESATPRRVSLDGSQDGPLQTMPARASSTKITESADHSDADESTTISRDRAILADPDAPSWKREAALAHLAQLKVRV